MTMTNAELAAAIEWAASRLDHIGSNPATSVAADERLIFDHLSELLKIQRERAVIPDGDPPQNYRVWREPPQ